MAKSKREKQAGGSKNKRPTNDQNSGPQQLDEDRKPGHPDLKDAITADLKKVRKRVSTKLDRRLLNSRKQKSVRTNK